jgi:hypothetical protein
MSLRTRMDRRVLLTLNVVVNRTSEALEKLHRKEHITSIT